ncbi:hypothetical protein M885DRAFT_613476 [Pelagophyceae sp. CCMP2097]|nr:hypothetical protein M885DRAFT_613476 [Pelagophyceae sp. CCMP2097]
MPSIAERIAMLSMDKGGGAIARRPSAHRSPAGHPPVAGAAADGAAAMDQPAGDDAPDAPHAARNEGCTDSQPAASLGRASIPQKRRAPTRRKVQAAEALVEGIHMGAAGVAAEGPAAAAAALASAALTSAALASAAGVSGDTYVDAARHAPAPAAPCSAQALGAGKSWRPWHAAEPELESPQRAAHGVPDEAPPQRAAANPPRAACPYDAASALSRISPLAFARKEIAPPRRGSDPASFSRASLDSNSSDDSEDGLQTSSNPMVDAAAAASGARLPRAPAAAQGAPAAPPRGAPVSNATRRVSDADACDQTRRISDLEEANATLEEGNAKLRLQTTARVEYLEAFVGGLRGMLGTYVHSSV